MSSPTPHKSWMDAEFLDDFESMSSVDREYLRYKKQMIEAMQQDIHRHLSDGRKHPFIPPQSAPFGGAQGQNWGQVSFPNAPFPGLQGGGNGGSAQIIPTLYAPPALDEDSPAADDAQRQALEAMNPLARLKYAELFKVLEIKVRFTNMARSAGGGTAWILAKMGADGKMIRQEWSAPSRDPGCSLRTWDAMMGELMDEVTRRKGIHVATDTDNSAADTGVEKPAGGTGNP